MPSTAQPVPELPNNNWTNNKETKLREWQLHSRLHNVCHGRAQERYAKRNKGLLLPSIIMGALATFFDGAALLWKEQAFPFIMSALFITLISTILSGILQATGPADEASKHEAMAKGYNKIILEIDSMLIKDYIERENGSRFITKISEELIALKTGGVKVPSDIWKGVQRSFLDGSLDFNVDEGKITDPTDSFAIEMQPISPKPPSGTGTSIGTSTERGDDGMDNSMVSISVAEDTSDPGQTGKSGQTDELDKSVEDTPLRPIPRFEMRLGHDPVKRRQLEKLYEFGQNRFS